MSAHLDTHAYRLSTKQEIAVKRYGNEADRVLFVHIIRTALNEQKRNRKKKKSKFVKYSSRIISCSRYQLFLEFSGFFFRTCYCTLAVMCVQFRPFSTIHTHNINIQTMPSPLYLSQYTFPFVSACVSSSSFFSLSLSLSIKCVILSFFGQKNQHILFLKDQIQMKKHHVTIDKRKRIAQ